MYNPRHLFAPNPTLSLEVTVPPRARVLCFAGAGCDATLFVTKGSAAKPLPNSLMDFCVENEIELLSYQLPGRGHRIDEKRFTDVLQAAEEALNALEPYLAKATPSQSFCGPVPLVIVGHSLGALIAYEVACLMRKRGLPPAKWLMIACMVAPPTPKTSRPWRESQYLSDSEFRQELKEWGVNDDVFRPGIWEVFEPILRADMFMVDNYSFTEPRSVAAGAHSGGPPVITTTSVNSPTTASSNDSPKKQSFHAPLGINTLVVSATRDSRIGADHMQAWHRVIMGTNLFQSSPSGFGTAANNGSEFVAHEVNGGHNFLYEPVAREDFFSTVTERLDQLLIDAEYGSGV